MITSQVHEIYLMTKMPVSRTLTYFKGCPLIFLEISVKKVIQNIDLNEGICFCSLIMCAAKGISAKNKHGIKQNLFKQLE